METIVLYLQYYIIGMFIYIALKGFKRGFLEGNSTYIDKSELVLYPLYFVMELFRYLGLLVVNMVSYLVNKLG